MLSVTEKSCCGNEAPTNPCRYYFQFVVNFLSELGDWWIPRALLFVLKGNYWSLLPLVTASICWSAHESPTAWIIEMTLALFLMMFESRRKKKKNLLQPLTAEPTTLHSLPTWGTYSLFSASLSGRWWAQKTGDTRVFTGAWAHNNCSNFDNDALWIMTLRLSVHSLNCV